MTKNKTIHPTNNERDTAMFLHLSTFCGFIFPIVGLIVPIIIWFMKKEESEYINLQGKILFNSWITYTIFFIISFALMLVLIGFLTFAVVFVVDIIETIRAAIRARNNEPPRNYLWAFDIFKTSNN